MIKDMTPQPYPLWAVEHGETTEVLVLGWLAEGEAMTPVVLDLTELGASPYPAAVECTFFADRDRAEEAAMANLYRRGR